MENNNYKSLLTSIESDLDTLNEGIQLIDSLLGDTLGLIKERYINNDSEDTNQNVSLNLCTIWNQCRLPVIVCSFNNNAIELVELVYGSCKTVLCGSLILPTAKVEYDYHSIDGSYLEVQGNIQKYYIAPSVPGSYSLGYQDEVAGNEPT